MKAIFLTDQMPFPPTDGRKVPVANYAWELERRGFEVAIVTAHKNDKASRPFAILREAWQRVNPFAGYYTTEAMAEGDRAMIAEAGPALLFVAPARLIGLAARCKAQNPDLRIVLLLNDAQWSQYWEALLYGLGVYRGGAMHDLLKGLLCVSAGLRELTAYRPADVVVLQTRRELVRLPWIGRKAVVAPNAVDQPQVGWCGQGSSVFASQVNFANRRAPKLKPFITQDWPKIHAENPDLRIELFGPGENPPDWVQRAAGVEYVGLVEDIDAYLRAKRALLVPLEHATGISNTVLRGLALDMPMVITRSSSLGVRDTIEPWPSDRVSVASSPREFIRETLALSIPARPARPQQIGSWQMNMTLILARLGLDPTRDALDDEGNE